MTMGTDKQFDSSVIVNTPLKAKIEWLVLMENGTLTHPTAKVSIVGVRLKWMHLLLTSFCPNVADYFIASYLKIVRSVAQAETIYSTY